MLRTIFVLLATLAFHQSAYSAALPSQQESAAELITAIDFIRETPGQTLGLPSAQRQFDQGNGQRLSRTMLTFGISNKPVWVRLTLHNPANDSVSMRMTAGVTWIEELDVYYPQNGGNTVHWQAGDAWSPNQHFMPGVGLIFDLEISPGTSEVYLRAETLDPMTLPIQLMSISDARQADVMNHVGYGLLCGILLVLIAYNLVIYQSLKQSSSLFYSLYIGCFLLLSSGYSGFGFAWFYPWSPLIQNYCTLLFMVLHGASGLLFSSSFLALKQTRPRLNRVIRVYLLAGIGAMLPLIVTNNQLGAAYVAFVYLSLTTCIMILVGIVNRNRVDDAGFYLIAVSISMLGVLITSLSVWGIIPFTLLGFHSAEIGVVCEAILLAAILSKKLKLRESERIKAKYLSSYDPLTHLFNRRSFMELGKRLIEVASQNRHPLSLVVIDLDHFKAINDKFGHQLGDQVLAHIALLLKQHVRTGDVVARWGGEEMILLMPSTDARQARAFAERLRIIVESRPLVTDGSEIVITASFGVATRLKGETLEELFSLADKRLYQAKRLGRNRVEPAPESLKDTLSGIEDGTTRT